MPISDKWHSPRIGPLLLNANNSCILGQGIHTHRDHWIFLYISFLKYKSKIEINCDESIFEWHNVYKIKKRIGMQGFLCKLEVNDGKLNETKIVTEVREFETAIMTTLWELYHKKVK
jgi:hypothetical protein